MEGFFIFPFVLVIIVGAIYISYSFEEEKRRAWRKFADEHRLTFSPGTFPIGGASVYGDYGKHHLELSTYSANKKTYTRMRVSIKRTTFRKKSNGAQPASVTSLLSANGAVYVSEKPEIKGRQVCYQEQGAIKDAQALKRIADLLASIAEGYPKVLAMESEAILDLHLMAQDSGQTMQKVAHRLLEDIGQTTTSRLRPRASQICCPRCLTRFGKHKISLPWWQSVTYYGCRSCGQSKDYLQGKIIAVLDNPASAQATQQSEEIRVTWQGTLFDFDTVEIVNATDEAVERFAVMVGNDTDSERKDRYRTINCTVAPGCVLSKNSERVLDRIFGEIKKGQV